MIKKKQILGLKVIGALCIASWTFASLAASPQDWQGAYAMDASADSDSEGDSSPDSHEKWFGHLQIESCTGKTCKFEFSSGSEQSECSDAGTFQIVSADKGENREEVKPDKSDAEGPRGTCIVSLERRKNHVIFVDAKDVFKNKKDEDLGNPCNTLCGAQGARYFGVELRKISDKKLYSPSFSCFTTQHLTKIETEICTNENLSKLDRDLSGAVDSAKSAHPADADKIKTAQRAWMKTRNQKCGSASSIGSCLEPMYQARIKELKP